MLTRMRVGIVGASGYTGAELLRLAAGHPELEVVLVTGDTQAGTPVADLYPSLLAAYGDLTFAPYTAEAVGGRDLGRWVLDLSADFRLKDPALYPQWYGAEHSAPELLSEFAYGLPELFRDEMAGAPGVAVPGCYPTAASLALAPLVRAGAVETEGIVGDAASGVSGAGRALKPTTQFCAVDEHFAAYGLLDHRHTPEIEQVLGATVLFTPHLAPMTRGILATCYARPAAATS